MRSGSSPRGRGTPQLDRRAERQARFIPAWAGNTVESLIMYVHAPVHPRVGGEHPNSRTWLRRTGGSSPRGRGTRQNHGQPGQLRRFIPAWAGNTPGGAIADGSIPVHPRVGGEHSPWPAAGDNEAGSSPRGRGTLDRVVDGQVPVRFIPAWAGNTRSARTPPPLSPVHPRVGGEHGSSAEPWYIVFGSSPRGRGTLGRPVECDCAGRFIPAWAGNTGSRCVPLVVRPVHPRVGGEHKRRCPTPRAIRGSSPRGRGTQDFCSYARHSRRFIPAWAGNTLPITR